MKQTVKQFLWEHTLLAWCASLALWATETLYIKMMRSAGQEPSAIQIGFMIGCMGIFSFLSLLLQKKYKDRMPKEWKTPQFQRSLRLFLIGLLIICIRLGFAFIKMEGVLLLLMMMATVVGSALLVYGALSIMYRLLRSE